MAAQPESRKSLPTVFGSISLAIGTLEWLAILGCVLGSLALGRSAVAGYATLTMFASLPVTLWGVPLGLYGGWRGRRWVGFSGAALCLMSYALGGFILHDIVGNR